MQVQNECQKLKNSIEEEELVFFKSKPRIQTSEDNFLPDLTHRTFLDFFCEVIILLFFTITVICIFSNNELNQPINPEFPQIISEVRNNDGSLTKYYDNGIIVQFHNNGSYTTKLDDNPKYQSYP